MINFNLKKNNYIQGHLKSSLSLHGNYDFNIDVPKNLQYRKKERRFNLRL